jgi:hypothetical protein
MIFKVAQRKSTFIIIFTKIYNNGYEFGSNMIYAWPKWPTLGLTIAFVFEYIDAFYRDNDSMIEKEYNKLKGK